MAPSHLVHHQVVAALTESRTSPRCTGRRRATRTPPPWPYSPSRPRCAGCWSGRGRRGSGPGGRTGPGSGPRPRRPTWVRRCGRPPRRPVGRGGAGPGRRGRAPGGGGGRGGRGRGQAGGRRRRAGDGGGGPRHPVGRPRRRVGGRGGRPAGGRADAGMGRGGGREGTDAVRRTRPPRRTAALRTARRVGRPDRPLPADGRKRGERARRGWRTRPASWSASPSATTSPASSPPNCRSSACRNCARCSPPATPPGN